MATVNNMIVNGSLRVGGTIYGELEGVASSADTLTGTLPISLGGTGATTAPAALVSLGLSATAAELNYCDGVTSNIQTQLNGKQATITGGATTITGSNLTANKILISNSSGKVAVSSIASTQLDYLSGVSSNIQTQLNSCMKFYSGSLAPSDTSGKTVWYDTTNKILKFYVNSAWQGMNTYQ